MMDIDLDKLNIIIIEQNVIPKYVSGNFHEFHILTQDKNGDYAEPDRDNTDTLLLERNALAQKFMRFAWVDAPMGIKITDFTLLARPQGIVSAYYQHQNERGGLKWALPVERPYRGEVMPEVPYDTFIKTMQEAGFTFTAQRTHDTTVLTNLRGPENTL